MLKSMVCETPLVANEVGAVPDIVDDGNNGFLLENNSPEEIAKNILKAINNNNLQNISKKCQ